MAVVFISCSKNSEPKRLFKCPHLKTEVSAEKKLGDGDGHVHHALRNAGSTSPEFSANDSDNVHMSCLRISPMLYIELMIDHDTVLRLAWQRTVQQPQQQRTVSRHDVSMNSINPRISIERRYLYPRSRKNDFAVNGSAKIARSTTERVVMHDSVNLESAHPAEFQITPSGRNRHECYTQSYCMSFVRSLFHIHLTLLSFGFLLSGLFVPDVPSGLSSLSPFRLFWRPFGALYGLALRKSEKREWDIRVTIRTPAALPA
ncbi:hypothetical protein DAPPUDRAFT_259734 [Daphnia pulex]|uniref:Uncharacterized protein n=1 Tax=Daphnia pulex TaxID=6669 RepID=E9HHS2_DAPPU|nr:hypothetical protein DAPPUDRAFT_259734 [Daphnia pulex]|eukprot:EFX68680.1 hypothetical protein DAPPUDRAFT_259734 [Daphnia pulex]